VVGEFARALPGAAVWASVADAAILPELLDGVPVHTTPLQGTRRLRIPLVALAPLLPTTFRRLDVGPAAVVLSSSSGFAHHVRPPTGARHVAYVHTPPHFLWEVDGYYEGRPWLRRVVRPYLESLRRADRAAIRRVDVLLANSAYTAERLAAIHGRAARVLHPPVDTERFTPTTARSGRFLVVARLRRHKRLELALQAAIRAGRPLDVIGDGPDEAFLRGVAGPTVRFLGRLDDAAVADAMARCTALVVPGTEDFGLTMAEVQAAGRPVVAHARGGALEIVRDGETGFLIADDDADALVEGMRRAESTELDVAALVASAARFRRAVFDDALRSIVAETPVR
jgi:glycosyltransferase involved in cell wall biosynthesis